MNYLNELKIQVSNRNKRNFKKEVIHEIDLKQIASHFDPKQIYSSMKLAIKNPKLIEKVNGILPKKDIIKKISEVVIKDREDDFKKSQSHFKSFFNKSIENKFAVTNLSNSMSFLSLAISSNNKSLEETHKKIDSMLMKFTSDSSISESENLNEFVFPVLDYADESSTTGKKIANYLFGVLQVIGQAALITATHVATAGTSLAFIAPICIFISLWLIWACLPDNIKSWWIMIPL